jgi:hypothetical protein
MNTHRRLRIALLTHSTNPRGGVVHALQLGEALTDLGHDVVVHAPDTRNEGFFRKVRCGTALVPARPVKGGLGALVGARIDEYVRYFSRRGTPAFDVYHEVRGLRWPVVDGKETLDRISTLRLPLLGCHASPVRMSVIVGRGA